MAIHTETAAYRLETARNGLFVVLTRKSDGADVHVQGDDADRMIVEAEEMAVCWASKPARFVEFFNYWASQYDDVMTIR